MRYLVLVAVLAAACSDKAKDREIAELKARVTAQEQGKALMVATSPDLSRPRAAASLAEGPHTDLRAPLLLQLCVEVEEHGGATLYNLGIKDDDVFDDNGHVKDPSAFCSLLRDKAVRRSGKETSHIALVNSYGPAIGTQMWNGTLCAEPAVHIDREVPTRDELLARLATKVNRDVGVWAREVHQNTSDLLDENGRLRDVSALAAAIRASAIKRYGKTAKHVMLQSGNFGGELGAALYAGRLDPAPLSSEH